MRNITIDEFNKLKVGDIISYIKPHTKYKVVRKHMDGKEKIFELQNMKYLGATDYINENICDEFELYKQ